MRSTLGHQSLGGRLPFALIPAGIWPPGGDGRVAGVGELIEQAERGRVTTLVCEPVAFARGQLRAAAEELEPVPTLVELEWEQAPSLARELDEIRDAIAEAARSLWPAWYGSAEDRFAPRKSHALGVDELAAKIAEHHPGASASWLRAAYRRCEQGQRPLVRHMAAAEQIRQLAIALDPARLTFVLSVNDAETTPARLRGLARAAEWLSRESQAKTLLLVPESWRGRAELDPVSYGAVSLDVGASGAPGRASPAVTPLGPGEIRRHGAARDTVPASGAGAMRKAALATGVSNDNGRATGGATTTPQVSVGPILGRPHPASEVEQLVWARLSADTELRGLFECNQRLTAFGDTHYIVDLVWRTGKLVVELDGPEHNGQLAYGRDRERDYRLLVSGYATLRVLNQEVCADVDSVITKIRNVVHRLSPVKKEISR